MFRTPCIWVEKLSGKNVQQYSQYANKLADTIAYKPVRFQNIEDDMSVKQQKVYRFIMKLDKSPIAGAKLANTTARTKAGITRKLKTRNGANINRDTWAAIL